MLEKNGKKKSVSWVAFTIYIICFVRQYLISPLTASLSPIQRYVFIHHLQMKIILFILWIAYYLAARMNFWIAGFDGCQIYQKLVVICCVFVFYFCIVISFLNNNIFIWWLQMIINQFIYNTFLLFFYRIWWKVKFSNGW